mmetsp:Transcript_16092/g.62757  ORF Transcript_16092/g.62757 Transcript_16092/m.62757 type:complete len:229 (+) Transcript_16092:783-1469(+)
MVCLPPPSRRADDEPALLPITRRCLLHVVAVPLRPIPRCNRVGQLGREPACTLCQCPPWRERRPVGCLLHLLLLVFVLVVTLRLMVVDPRVLLDVLGGLVPEEGQELLLGREVPPLRACVRLCSRLLCLVVTVMCVPAAPRRWSSPAPWRDRRQRLDNGLAGAVEQARVLLLLPLLPLPLFLNLRHRRLDLERELVEVLVSEALEVGQVEDELVVRLEAVGLLLEVPH